jgi:flagellar biosynthesis/type III secretory pathway chaperone
MANYAGGNIDPVRQEKLQAYQGYLQATLRLKEALQKEEMAKVERLLADRERLAAQVDRLDQQIRRHEPTANYPHPANPNRQDESVALMAEILRLIVAVNEDCDSLAASKCAELKDNLLIIRRQEAGVHGYAAQPNRQPVFLNVMS